MSRKGGIRYEYKVKGHPASCCQPVPCIIFIENGVCRVEAVVNFNTRKEINRYCPKISYKLYRSHRKKYKGHNSLAN